MRDSSIARTITQQFLLNFIQASNSYSALGRYLGYFPFANYYMKNAFNLSQLMADINWTLSQDLYVYVWFSVTEAKVRSRMGVFEDQVTFFADLIHSGNTNISLVIDMLTVAQLEYLHSNSFFEGFERLWGVID